MQLQVWRCIVGSSLLEPPTRVTAGQKVLMRMLAIHLGMLDH
jgi:hypothetical protein